MAKNEHETGKIGIKTNKQTNNKNNNRKFALAHQPKHWAQWIKMSD